jgi:LysR family hydrogen peroxide-inducible transcriptional activator
MAVDELSPRQMEAHIKAFAPPIPTREVSLVYTRSFLKETIITALEACIIKNLPGHIKSLKRQHVQVVDI